MFHITSWNDVYRDILLVVGDSRDFNDAIDEKKWSNNYNYSMML